MSRAEKIEYINGEKGGRIAVNREISMSTIINQLPDMEDRELEMTADFIRGLKLARKFCK